MLKKFIKLNFRLLGLSLIGILLLAFESSHCQGMDNILRHKSLEEIKVEIARLEKKHKNNPGVLYLKAAIESDGKKAVGLYENIVLKYPKSSFADDAKFKIGQYYFSIGFYNLAYEQFNELVYQYPNSPLRDDGAYYSAQCLIAMDKTREAINELTRFQKDFSTSSLVPLAIDDIRKLKGEYSSNSNNGSDKHHADVGRKDEFPFQASSVQDNSTPTNSPQDGRFSVQVGAYLSEKNAKNQKKYFDQNGYPAQVYRKKSNRQNLYVVCVNTFTQHLNAVQFGEMLKEKFKIPFQVVNLDEF